MTGSIGMGKTHLLRKVCYAPAGQDPRAIVNVFDVAGDIPIAGATECIFSESSGWRNSRTGRWMRSTRSCSLTPYG